MALALRLATEMEFRPDKLARHYGWPLWKAESAVGYMGEFAGELAGDEEALIEEAGRDKLRKKLPRMEEFSA
jgi:hypothetical protein